jgi:hypothetical protein
LHCRRHVGAKIADAHREQREHDREVAGGVHGEGHAGPREGDDEPAERGPDDPRRRSESGAERDRIGQVGLPDDPEDERVPRRVAEHEDEALERRDQVHVPEGDGTGQREDRERARGDDQQRLGDEQQPADVQAVDHRADEETEEGHRE